MFLSSVADKIAVDLLDSLDVPAFKLASEDLINVDLLEYVATKKRPEVKIDWRIYTKNPEKPLIRDLIIEGLSLARTQKEEFASILNSNDGSINALFASLEKFINN